jgi:GntR family transcriptional regulator / MocR family aminotransferase
MRRDLTRNPFRRRSLCDVDPDQVSARYLHDDECIEEVETDRRDDEEVHGGNIWSMVAQEREPSLVRRPASPDRVFGTHAQLLLAKLKPHAIPVDVEGLIVDAGRRKAPRARAVFVTPSHQFPTGVAMSMARRLELLAWARQSGGFIVEDDFTSEFRYSGPPLASLQGLDDSDQVIYVGTFNKALFPGLRIGYAVVPRALLAAFVGARYLIDRQPATLQQAVVSEFMAQGHFAARIRRMRQLYREQRDALVETLTRRAAGPVEVVLPDQGMHLVAYMSDGSSDIAIEERAREAGIVVRAISRFYRAAHPRCVPKTQTRA